jgi:hypothetical protein
MDENLTEMEKLTILNKILDLRKEYAKLRSEIFELEGKLGL